MAGSTERQQTVKFARNPTKCFVLATPRSASNIFPTPLTHISQLPGECHKPFELSRISPSQTPCDYPGERDERFEVHSMFYCIFNINKSRLSADS